MAYPLLYSLSSFFSPFYLSSHGRTIVIVYQLVWVPERELPFTVISNGVRNLKGTKYRGYRFLPLVEMTNIQNLVHYIGILFTLNYDEDCET